MNKIIGGFLVCVHERRYTTNNMAQERSQKMIQESDNSSRILQEMTSSSVKEKTKEQRALQERKEFEQKLESIREVPSFSGKIQLTDELLKLGEDGFITPEVQTRSQWLVDWAIKSVKFASKEGMDSSKVHDAEFIHETFFSFSPCVFSYLRLTDQLSTLAKASRVTELQGTLVQPFIGEVVYSLSFATSPEQILEEVWLGLPLSDKLDFVDFLPTIFAYANAQGDWAVSCAQAAERMLKMIREKEDSFFIETLASEAEDRINVEQEQPSIGIVQRRGDRRVGRMRVDQKGSRPEDALLKKKIPLEYDASVTLQRISRDVIASFDHAAIPQGYLPLTEEEETMLPEFSVNQERLQEIDRWLERPSSQLRPQAKWWCLTNIQRHILSPEEMSGTAWEARSPVLSAEQWNKYWKLERDQEAIYEMIRPLRALSERTNDQQKRLDQLMWQSGLIEEEHQPLTDLVYRDPTLPGVMRSLVRQIPRLKPVHFESFEKFEGNKQLMPKGEKVGIEASVLLQVIHRPYVREALEEKIGISLTELSLREQIQLLSFLAQTNSEKSERVFRLIERFGVVAAQSFLSCEYDPKMGDMILTLAGERESDEVINLFERYSALVARAATSSEELLKLFYQVGEGTAISRETFEDSLLSRAKQMMSEAAKNSKLPLENILKGYEEDLAVFVSLFRSVFKGTRVAIPFESIRGLSIESIQLQEMTQERKQVLYQELQPLIHENWTRSDTDVGMGVLKRFEELFFEQNISSTFFVLRREGEVVAFVRFDDRPDLGESAVYAGSLNVSKTFQDSGIGGAFVREMVEQRIGEKELYADVLASDAVGSFYVEELGCVIDGVKRPKEGGDPFLSLHRSQKLNELLKTKKEALHLVGASKESAAFDLPSEKEGFIRWIEETTKNKQVVTHYKISRGPTGEQRRFLMAELIPMERASVSIPSEQAA